MILCQVIGNITATVKHPGYQGRKVMVVQPVNPENFMPAGDSFLSVDLVSAGPRELVLVNKEGGSSLIAIGDYTIPVHSTITGIVDNITQRN